MEGFLKDLHPIHARRMKLISSKMDKTEKTSEFLTRLSEEGNLAELKDLTQSALILHLFVDGAPKSESLKTIRNLAVEQLREKPNMDETSLHQILAKIKGLEADLAVSEEGTSKNTARLTQVDRPEGCYNCGIRGHPFYNCQKPCQNCGKNGHSKHRCRERPSTKRSPSRKRETRQRETSRGRGYNRDNQERQSRSREDKYRGRQFQRNRNSRDRDRSKSRLDRKDTREENNKKEKPRRNSPFPSPARSRKTSTEREGEREENDRYISDQSGYNTDYSFKSNDRRSRNRS